MKNPHAPIDLARRRALGTAMAAAWLASGCASTQLSGDQSADARDTVDKARITIEELTRDKNFGAMHEGLKRARGVLIFPQIIRGAFFVGGSGGTGVLLAHEGDNWVGPAFYTIGSASLGVQFGGEAAQVVILVNSQKALDGLYTSHLKLGTDASVAAGPIGQGGGLAITSDLVSYSKSKGAFVGISLEGSVLDVRESLNTAYYGRSVTPLDILVRHTASNPQADALRAAVRAAVR